MRIDDDWLIFSTGKRVYANRGFVGLGIGYEGEWVVLEGYDGDIDIDNLTPEERRELAQHMIQLWTDCLASDFGRS